MNLNKIKTIFDCFKHNSKLIEVKELNAGHINDTYLIICENKPSYILQKINHLVFKNIEGLISNKVKITQHIQSKSSSLDTKYSTLKFIPTKKKSYYHYNGNSYWNLMLYMEDSISFEKVTDEKVALEAGTLFGNFLNLTSDFNTDDLVETIPDFHNMQVRFTQFDEALVEASKERLKLAEKEIKKANNLKEEVLTLNRLRVSGKIPIRVTHSDTKVSNALFTKDNKGLCVIDLDTVMPGIIHYDFGDAIRSICNNADEDEKDLTKVTFNLEFYKNFVKGFIVSIKSNISKIEVDYLAISAKIMTFIMALRMLTDFLNGDVYYKTTYELHNLNRAKNQLKLIEEMDKILIEMKLIINDLYLK